MVWCNGRKSGLTSVTVTRSAGWTEDDGQFCGKGVNSATVVRVAQGGWCTSGRDSLLEISLTAPHSTMPSLTRETEEFGSTVDIYVLSVWRAPAPVAAPVQVTLTKWMGPRQWTGMKKIGVRMSLNPVLVSRNCVTLVRMENTGSASVAKCRYCLLNDKNELYRWYAVLVRLICVTGARMEDTRRVNVAKSMVCWLLWYDGVQWSESVGQQKRWVGEG